MTAQPPAGCPFAGRFLHCGCWVAARTARAWKVLCAGPCPHCGRKGW